MSWQLSLLNRHLRWFEKPALAKHAPDQLRRSFDRKAKLNFHPQPGTRYTRGTLGGVPVQWARAADVAEDPVILYFHGGGFVFGSSDSHRVMLADLSTRTGLPACLPDYRLAPEHPFPAQIEDALAVYKALSAGHQIILGGDSAGGGLALSLLHEICTQELGQPLGTFAFSPITDMTFSGASVQDCARTDNVLSTSRIAELTELVLAGQDPKDPRVSPLFGRFTGAGPVWLTAGDREFLRDDSVRMHAALKRQDVHSCLSIQPDHPHVWPLFHTILPEARSTLADLAGWIRPLVS